MLRYHVVLLESLILQLQYQTGTGGFKRNDDGYVISNETVNARDINANITDSLIFYFIISNINGIISAENSYLSVGPVDDTYNNTSYQCIFTINDTITESDTAGTITVIGKQVHDVYGFKVYSVITYLLLRICKLCPDICHIIHVHIP